MITWCSFFVKNGCSAAGRESVPWRLPSTTCPGNILGPPCPRFHTVHDCNARHQPATTRLAFQGRGAVSPDVVSLDHAAARVQLHMFVLCNGALGVCPCFHHSVFHVFYQSFQRASRNHRKKVSHVRGEVDH